MTIASMLNNAEKLDINADITDNQYYKNRNLMLMSKPEMENMRLQEMAIRQETINEYSKVHEIQRMKQFLEGCQVSRESSTAVNNKPKMPRRNLLTARESRSGSRERGSRPITKLSKEQS